MSTRKRSPESKNFEKRLFSDRFIYDPVSVIDRFNSAIKKYGEDKVFEDRRFQKSREMWISSVFLLGFYEITEPKIDYWLKPCYDQWPDTYGVFFSPRKDIEDIDIQNWFHIEITEWDEHSSKELSDQILKKIRDKNYPKNYTLVIYVKKIGIKIDLRAAFEKLKKSNVPNLYIFVVTSDINKSGDHCIACLHPEYKRENFYLQEIMEKLKKDYDFVEVKKGRGHDISPPIPKLFPLPELE
jgi:hypothetical protein